MERVLRQACAVFYALGNFTNWEKKWKKQDNVEFLELHQQSQVSETLQNLHGRIEEFYFERIMEELDLLSQNSEIFENDESFLVSDDFRMLSKYFFSNMELEELVSMLNMEFKKKVGRLSQLVLTLKTMRVSRKSFLRMESISQGVVVLFLGFHSYIAVS